MREEIIETFIETLKEIFDLEFNEEEFAKILEKEFFDGEKIVHPELKFIMELLEKIDIEDNFDEEE